MSDIYRGSTPTLVFKPESAVSGTPKISLIQGETRLYPEVTQVSGAYRCTLTSAETSLFVTTQPVLAQLYFVGDSDVVYMPVHRLTVGENYFDFQETVPSPEELAKAFIPMSVEIDDNPAELGFYELVNDAYVLTTDTAPVDEKEYYGDVAEIFGHKFIPTVKEPMYNPVEDFEEDDSPFFDGWYELSDGAYVRSMDQAVVSGKSYYVLDDPEFDDEYDDFTNLFDGDSFAADNGYDPNWEDDLDNKDYNEWDPTDDFTDADNIDEFVVSYTAVTPTGTENPLLEGWLEYVSDSSSYEFTEDTVVDDTKTYYDMEIEDPEGIEGDG